MATAGEAGKALKGVEVLKNVEVTCEAAKAEKAADAAKAAEAAKAALAAKVEEAAKTFKGLDDNAKDLLAKFMKGEQGASVKEVSLEGKSLRQIDNELSGPGGWLRTPDGKLLSQDGKWVKTEKVITENPDGTPCTPYRMIFYENSDGGVVRLKPDGMPDAKYDHMKQPHGTKYVKRDPNGGTGFDNEAFKVDGEKPIPRKPDELQLPPGIQPSTPEAESFIQKTWKTPSHVPLKKE